MGLDLGADDRCLRALGGPARRLRRLGEPRRRAAGAVRDPAHEDRPRRQRGRLHPRHGAVLDVPDADAVHAAGARLLGDEDGRRVPRGGRHVDHLGECRSRPGEQGRRPLADRGRDGAARGRHAPLHAGAGRRLVRVGPAARLPDHRARDGALLRADLDRGPRRRAAGRGRARVGPDQHVAAGRRRGRDRAPRRSPSRGPRTSSRPARRCRRR